jgi:hypothetical protein
MAPAPGGPVTSSQINREQLKIELIEPETPLAMVRIVWPPQSTIVDPKRFPTSQLRSRNC